MKKTLVRKKRPGKQETLRSEYFKCALPIFPPTIALIGDLLPDIGKVVLAIGVLNVGQQLRTLAHQMGSSLPKEYVI